MALLIMYDDAAAIQEQTVKRLFLLEIFEEEGISRAFFNFFGAARKDGSGWIG